VPDSSKRNMMLQVRHFFLVSGFVSRHFSIDNRRKRTYNYLHIALNNDATHKKAGRQTKQDVGEQTSML
jgi:hypothetical protein